MARKKSQTLTDSELRLMNILWDRSSGTVNDVLNELPKDQPLAYSTVLTFLRILEQKGYIRHNKRGRAFVYYPIVDRREARRSVLHYVINRFFNDSPGQLLLSVLENEKVSSDDLKKLETAINAKS